MSEFIVPVEERESFARDVETIGEGKPLAVCAITLEIWAKMFPPQGSMAARCAIMAEHVSQTVDEWEKKRRNR